MEFELRDWLLVLGPLFIVGVLVHGFWRMRASRSTLKMSLDKRFLSENGAGPAAEGKRDLSFFKAELPNGGARLVSEPEQVALDLNEEVPVLMEPVEMGDAIVAEKPVAEGSTQKWSAKDEASPLSDVLMVEQAESVTRDANTAAETQRPGSDCPERFVILYVAAVHEPFAGQQLLECLLEQGMIFGEMDIFHRCSASGEILFSTANAVAPGTFVVSEMHLLNTPAISLFMRAHELNDPLAVYDQMIEIAQNLAIDLVGEVKDESRSVLTPQTVEHGRQSLIEFVHRYYC